MPLYSKPEIVKKAFIENEKPFYIVYGKDTAPFRTNSTEDDLHAAADGLYKWLKDIEYTGELKIYQFDKMPAKVTKEKLADASYISYAFKWTSEEKTEWKERMGYNQPQGTDPALIAILDRMEQREAAAAERLEKIEKLVLEMAESDDDDEIEEKAENNVLGAVLGNPAVQNILLTLATNLGAGLAANHTKQNVRPVAMAGVVDENPEVNELVEKLFAKGVTVDHLRKLSEMPAVKIKSLLLML